MAASLVFLIFQVALYILISYNLSLYQIGIYSLGTTLVFIPLSIIETAFSNALIYAKEVGEHDYNEVLRLNLLISGFSIITIIFVGLIVYGLGKSLTFVYIGAALIPCLIFVSFNSVQIAGLKRDFDFKTIAIIDALSNTIYFLVVLILLLRWKIAALVIALFVRYLATSGLLIYFKKHYSSKSIFTNRKTSGAHFTFGKYIVMDRILSGLMSYLDILIIGSFLGYANLGIYEILKKTIVRPLLVFYQALENVFLPILSRHNINFSKYNNIYSIYSAFCSLLLIPVFIVLFFNAELVLQLFPKPYLEHIQSFKLLCLMGVSIIIFNPMDMIMYSMGRTKTFFNWMLAYTAPLIILLLISVSHGLTTLIVTYTSCYFILFILGYVILDLKKHLDFSTFMKVSLSSVLMFGTFYLLDKLSLGDIFRIIISIIFLFLCLIKISILLFRNREEETI